MIRDQYIFSMKIFPADGQIHIIRHMADGLGLAALVEFTNLKQGILDAGRKIREGIEDDITDTPTNQPAPRIITRR